MNPTQKEITAGGVTYVFRLPSQMDMVEIDVKALKLREGLTEGVPLAYSYSQNIAMMEQLCTSPENADFKKVPGYVGDKLGRELTSWVNSFSEDVGDQQETVDK
jgi:hypothetical protein